MSYDIRFAVKVEGADEYWVVGRPEYDSPTYNLRNMFVTCMDWDYEQGVYYRCDEVLPKIVKGIRELIKYEEHYKQFEAPNGWGTIDSALATLCSIECCLTEIKDKIPIKYVWMRW